MYHCNKLVKKGNVDRNIFKTTYQYILCSRTQAQLGYVF